MLLEQVRNLLSEVQYPLEFNPAEWKDNLDANCYEYALGLKIDEGYLIGDFIGKRVTKNDSIAKHLEVLLEELDALGFFVVECDTTDLTEENTFKIYIEWNEENEYHFLRQDLDFRWSQKAQGLFPTDRDENGFFIMDPEMNSKSVLGKCFILTRF